MKLLLSGKQQTYPVLIFCFYLSHLLLQGLNRLVDFRACTNDGDLVRLIPGGGYGNVDITFVHHLTYIGSLCTDNEAVVVIRDREDLGNGNQILKSTIERESLYLISPVSQCS